MLSCLTFQVVYYSLRFIEAKRDSIKTAIYIQFGTMLRILLLSSPSSSLIFFRQCSNIHRGRHICVPEFIHMVFNESEYPSLRRSNISVLDWFSSFYDSIQYIYLIFSFRNCRKFKKYDIQISSLMFDSNWMLSEHSSVKESTRL